MNTLTRNRIIEAGDEYLDGHNWKPVEPKNIGLQIMFSPYKEVRRPTEEPILPVPDTATARPASKAGVGNTAGAERDSGGQNNLGKDLPVPVLADPASKAGEAKDAIDANPEPESTESDKPRKNDHRSLERGTGSDSGGGQYLCREPSDTNSHLPTVISRKAHALGKPIGFDKDGGQVSVRKWTQRTIWVDEGDSEWTGRNGTFKTHGIALRSDSKKITVIPIGKRGAGNGMIQFPVSIIPQIVEWLEKQKPQEETP